MPDNSTGCQIVEGRRILLSRTFQARIRQIFANIVSSFINQLRLPAKVEGTVLQNLSCHANIFKKFWKRTFALWLPPLSM